MQVVLIKKTSWCKCKQTESGVHVCCLPAAVEVSDEKLTGKPIHIGCNIRVMKCSVKQSEKG